MVRRFKLVNGSGTEWDLMRFDAFFHAPDGLGFSRTITSIRAGFDYIQTDEYLNQQTVSGEMVFDGYAVYREFIDFVTDAPLSVGYAPQNDWYFRTCSVQSIGKTEIGAEGRLICPITFLCSGMWHETASANSIVSDIDSPKIYPYGYNYNYFESTLGSILISNGKLESPIILSILGPVENPTWSLQQGGEVIANGAVTANIAEGHKLVVDARPDSMQIAEYTLSGEYVQDLYSASDFSTERFLYAPAGDSVISVSGIGGTVLVGKNKLQNTSTDATDVNIEWEAQADGTELATGYNGTASDSEQVIGTATLPAGDYVLNGCPADGGAAAYSLIAEDAADDTLLATDTGAGDSFSLLAETDVRVAAVVAAGFPKISGGAVVFDDPIGNRPIPSVSAEFSPIQNLNGYDNPWVGGTGSNLLDFSKLTITRVSLSGTADDFTMTGTAVGAALASYDVLPYAGTTIYVAVDSMSRSGSFLSLTAIQFRYKQTAEDDYTYVTLATFDNDRVGPSEYSVAVPVGVYAAAIRVFVSSSTGDFTGATCEVKGLRIALESGTTWSPYENICPISGSTGTTVTRSGKNLIDVDNPTSSDSSWNYFDIPISNATLTLSLVSTVAGTQASGTITKADGTFSAFSIYTSLTGVGNKQAHTLQLDEGDTMSFRVAVSATDVQLEVGEIATDFEPYSATTFPISWQADAGTVYGGTVDLSTGILTATMVCHSFDGTEAITLTGNRYFRYSISANPANTSGAAISSHFDRSPYVNNTPFGYFALSTGNIVFCDLNSVYADAAAFKAYLAAQYGAGTPVQVCYTLATPITYQLTPTEIRTLLGANSIYSADGNVAVIYPLALTFKPMLRAAGTPAEYEQYREVEIVQAIAEVEKNVYSV